MVGLQIRRTSLCFSCISFWRHASPFVFHVLTHLRAGSRSLSTLNCKCFAVCSRIWEDCWFANQVHMLMFWEYVGFDIYPALCVFMFRRAQFAFVLENLSFLGCSWISGNTRFENQAHVLTFHKYCFPGVHKSLCFGNSSLDETGSFFELLV